MISRRGLLLALSSSMAAIGLTAISATAANAAKTYKVCKTTDISVRSGKTFNVGGKTILITQPKKGTFKAFVAICTHAGSALNGAINNEIVCQSHGARFDATTGMAKAVAPRALQKVSLSVSAGSVKVKF